MSRELENIRCALVDARSAVEWIKDRATHWSVRDMADRHLWSIKTGLEAYEKLSRDLRDGRKHIDVPDEDRERGPFAVNLQKASEGCRLCDTCEGVGVTMTPVYEGGAHCEKDAYCPDCDGQGEVEVTTGSAA